MADQYQPLSINTGSAQQAIQSTPNVTPNLEGLMQGISSGFISADDIRKRVSNGPLEAATRQQDLADVQQVRPLQREAAVAQLQNVQAKEQFEAESLPILNDTKREALKQEYQNVLQHGVPAAVMKTFNATVPGFIPYDNAKLFPKEGGVNTAYALEIMGKAFEKAEKLKQFAGAKPVDRVDVSPTGVKTTSQQNYTILGQPVGVPIQTGVQSPNAAEAEAKAAASAAGLSNDVLAERNRSDIIKRYVPQLGALDAIDTIRHRGTPPKNADDLAILYEFVKLLDPSSAVREGEKKFAESTAPGIQQLYNKVQGLWRDSNTTMDADTRNNMYATADTLRAGAEKTVLPELKRLSLLAIDRNTPLDQALTAPEIKLLVNGPTVLGAAPAPVPGASPAAAAAANIPTVQTPAEAAGLPSTVQFFKTPTGQVKINPNYRP